MSPLNIWWEMSVEFNELLLAPFLASVWLLPFFIEANEVSIKTHNHLIYTAVTSSVEYIFKGSGKIPFASLMASFLFCLYFLWKQKSVSRCTII